MAPPRPRASTLRAANKEPDGSVPVPAQPDNPGEADGTPAAHERLCFELDRLADARWGPAGLPKQPWDS